MSMRLQYVAAIHGSSEQGSIVIVLFGSVYLMFVYQLLLLNCSSGSTAIGSTIQGASKK